MNTVLKITQMNIYLLLGVPVLGELSPETKSEYVTLCKACNIRNEIIKNITYIFDSWNGEDLISGFAEYFISERLKIKLEENNIDGYNLQKIETKFTSKKSGKNRFGKNAYQNTLPNFYYLSVSGYAKGELKHWFDKISVCSVCNREKWFLNVAGHRSSSNPEILEMDREKNQPRNVYLDLWNKNDLFLLQDQYNFPIVTQKFVDILNDLQVPINKKGGIWFRPTSWIDAEGKIIE